jgi:predicted enzyme related to lactoylglutathione lyase
MPPTLANGKICYLEIPAIDINRSTDFYTKVFGWRIRKRGDGSIAFERFNRRSKRHLGSWPEGVFGTRTAGVHHG